MFSDRCNEIYFFNQGLVFYKLSQQKGNLHEIYSYNKTKFKTGIKTQNWMPSTWFLTRSNLNVSKWERKLKLDQLRITRLEWKKYLKRIGIFWNWHATVQNHFKCSLLPKNKISKQIKQWSCLTIFHTYTIYY